MSLCLAVAVQGCIREHGTIVEALDYVSRDPANWFSVVPREVVERGYAIENRLAVLALDGSLIVAGPCWVKAFAPDHPVLRCAQQNVRAAALGGVARPIRSQYIRVADGCFLLNYEPVFEQIGGGREARRRRTKVKAGGYVVTAVPLRGCKKSGDGLRVIPGNPDASSSLEIASLRAEPHRDGKLWTYHLIVRDENGLSERTFRVVTGGKVDGEGLPS